MKKKEFSQLLEGVRELGAALRGDKKVITRTDRLNRASVAVVRGRMKLSQGEFARMLGISLDRRATKGPISEDLPIARRCPSP